MNNEMEDDTLYYWKIGGAGTINCKNCSFNQDIISFIHGFSGDEPTSNSGFQCQQCGKFHAIEQDMENSQSKLCTCGGNLSRNEPLFCPVCKSTDLEYDMQYIT